MHGTDGTKLNTNLPSPSLGVSAKLAAPGPEELQLTAATVAPAIGPAPISMTVPLARRDIGSVGRAALGAVGTGEGFSLAQATHNIATAIASGRINPPSLDDQSPLR